MRNRRPFISDAHFDWPLMTGIILISIISLFILYSAKHDITLVEKQSLRLGLAFLLMFGIAQLPPRFFRTISPWLYGLGLLLLIFVLMAGHIGKGAQRWLDLWIFRFQPAEVMKIAVPLMIAAYFHN